MQHEDSRRSSVLTCCFPGSRWDTITSGLHGRLSLALYNSSTRNPTGKGDSTSVRDREGRGSMPKVTLVKEKQEIEVPAGANLRDEIRKAGIQVNFFPLDLPNGLLGRTMNCFGHG